MSPIRSPARDRFRIDRTPARQRPLVNLTPLIDVVFILLVFFLLTSSFLDWRGLPLHTGGAGADGTAAPAMLVDIDPAGIRLSGERVVPARLTAAVSRRLADDPDLRLVVRPAAGVPLQRTIDVLDRLRGAGARRFALSAHPGSGP